MVWQEEFGCPTATTSEAYQAHFYRNIFYSTLLAGSAGALGWCWSDYDCEDQRPFDHHPSELTFGAVRADGTPKPVAAEYERYARVMSEIDLARFRLPGAEAAILVPRFMYEDYPHLGIDRVACYTQLREAYTLTRTAHLDADFHREPEEPDRYRLLLSTCMPLYLAPYWTRLTRYVRSGGVLYQSFTASHQGGLWCQRFEELFGARHELRYGQADVPGSAKVTFRFVRPFADIAAGETLSFAVSGQPPATGYCPLTATTAEVVAVDDAGRPALIAHRLGAGLAVLSAYPLEYYSLQTPGVHPNAGLVRLYRALRRLAGIQPAFDCDNPAVELGWLVGPDGEHVLFAVNHALTAERISLTSAGPLRSVSDFETGEPAPLDVTLAAKQVRIWRVC